MRRKWRERIEALEEQFEALTSGVDVFARVSVESDPFDCQELWRGVSSDYAAWVDDEEEEGWRLRGYL